jgi:alpha-L-arabinofuranosidase
MFSHHYQPNLLATTVSGPAADLDICATLSEDRSRLVIQIVSSSEQEVALDLDIRAFTPRRTDAILEVLAGPLTAANSADNPTRIQPEQSTWPHQLKQGQTLLRLRPHSLSIVTIE